MYIKKASLLSKEAFFVSAGGLEPPTFTLKGCCSTTELRARQIFCKYILQKFSKFAGVNIRPSHLKTKHQFYLVPKNYNENRL
jgi:hypothetical protein